VANRDSQVKLLGDHGSKEISLCCYLRPVFTAQRSTFCTTTLHGNIHADNNVSEMELKEIAHDFHDISSSPVPSATVAYYGFLVGLALVPPLSPLLVGRVGMRLHLDITKDNALRNISALCSRHRAR